MLSLRDDQMLETCVFLSLIITHQAPAIHKSMIFMSQFSFHIITHQCTIILSSVYILIVSFCSSPLPACCILFPQIDSWWGRDWEIPKDSHRSSGLLMLYTYQHHGDFALQNLFIPFLCLTILPASKFDTVPSILVKYLTQILNSITSLVCRSPAPFVTTKYLLGHDPKRYKKLLL